MGDSGGRRQKGRWGWVGVGWLAVGGVPLFGARRSERIRRRMPKWEDEASRIFNSLHLTDLFNAFKIGLEFSETCHGALEVHRRLVYTDTYALSIQLSKKTHRSAHRHRGRHGTTGAANAPCPPSAPSAILPVPIALCHSTQSHRPSHLLSTRRLILPTGKSLIMIRTCSSSRMIR